MARLLVVSVETPPTLHAIDGVPEMPEALVADLEQAISMVPSGGKLADALKQDSTMKPRLLTAGWADEGAKDHLMQVRRWARDIGIAEERRGLVVNRAGDYTSSWQPSEPYRGIRLIPSSGLRILSGHSASS
jgi:hypothetical protein